MCVCVVCVLALLPGAKANVTSVGQTSVTTPWGFVWLSGVFGGHAQQHVFEIQLQLPWHVTVTNVQGTG